MQQKFQFYNKIFVEKFCKVRVVGAGYLWFNSFYFVTKNSTVDTASLCFL